MSDENTVAVVQVTASAKVTHADGTTDEDED